MSNAKKPPGTLPENPLSSPRDFRPRLGSEVLGALNPDPSLYARLNAIQNKTGVG